LQVLGAAFTGQAATFENNTRVAKAAIRLDKESAAREAAADRRDLKRDSDAAISKLRGGQQVPEVGALESRAEALEDGEVQQRARKLWAASAPTTPSAISCRSS